MGHDLLAVKRPRKVPLPNNAREIGPQIWETIYTHYYQVGDSYYIYDNSNPTADFSLNIHVAEEIRVGISDIGRDLFVRVFHNTVVDGATAALLADQLLIALEQGELATLPSEIVQNLALLLRFAGPTGILIVS